MSIYKDINIGDKKGNWKITNIFEFNTHNFGRTKCTVSCSCNSISTISLIHFLKTDENKSNCGCVDLLDKIGDTWGCHIIEEYIGQDKRGNQTFYVRCNVCSLLKVTTLANLNKTSGNCKHRLQESHGMSGTRTYRSWKAMKDRCNNPNNPNTDLYKGKGISYQPSWDNFTEFFKDIGERPEGTSIERVDNTLGYSKNNCVWATQKEQVVNRGKDRNTTSKYKGAYLDKRDGRWFSSIISPDGENIYLGTFPDEISAAKAWDEIATTFNYNTNKSLGIL